MQTKVIQLMKKSERKAIHKRLRKHYGAITEVASKSGVCRDMVLKVLKGERNNDKVLEVASKILLDRENKRSQLRQRIGQNVKEALAIAS